MYSYKRYPYIVIVGNTICTSKAEMRHFPHNARISSRGYNIIYYTVSIEQKNARNEEAMCGRERVEKRDEREGYAEEGASAWR